MTADEETAVVLEATECGVAIVEQICSRPGTGRAQDLADVAYAYHALLVCMLRDAEVSDEDKVSVHAIIDRVADAANMRGLHELSVRGRLREIDG